MSSIIVVVQIIIALGIFNVWLLRYGKLTGWRGGSARNMKEEFQIYGLPAWSVQVIGFLKLLCAVLLIAGIWLPALTKPAAIGMAVLMIGAIAMHFKVNDPVKKSLPAFIMLVLSAVVVIA